MDLRQAFEHAPRWERRLYELTGSDPESFDDAIARYDEFDEDQRSARSDLDLAVLLGESGLLERAGDLIEALDGTEGAGAKYGRWLEAAYLDAPLGRGGHRARRGDPARSAGRLVHRHPGTPHRDPGGRPGAAGPGRGRHRRARPLAPDARARAHRHRRRAAGAERGGGVAPAPVPARSARGRRAAAPALAGPGRRRPLLPGRLRLPADPGRGRAAAAAHAPGHRGHGAGGRPADALVGAALSARAGPDAARDLRSQAAGRPARAPARVGPRAPRASRWWARACSTWA